LALVLRVAWALLATRVDPYLMENPLFGDAKAYDAIAKHLVAGDGYTEDGVFITSWRAPGYPAFLGAIYLLFGANQVLVRLLQALIGVGTVALTYLIARRVGGPVAGFLASLILSVHPTVVYFGAWVATESLYTGMLTLALLLLLRANDRRSVRRTVLAGIAIGLAMLVRPQSVLVLPFFALALLGLSRGTSIRKQIALAVLLGVSAAAAVSPWTLRNYQVHHELVPIDTHGGYALYGSYLGIGDGTFVEPPNPDFSVMREIDWDRRYRRLGVDLFMEHPGSWFRSIPLKIWRMVSPVSTVVGEYQAWWTPLANGLNLVLLALAAFGGIVALRHDRSTLAIWGVIFGTMATAFIFYGTARFAVPMLPAVAIFAGSGILRPIPARIAIELGVWDRRSR
jgi:4-amino-4-deoxy-L-arabinose transferase-like glycosyltransferase